MSERVQFGRLHRPSLLAAWDGTLEKPLLLDGDLSAQAPALASLWVVESESSDPIVSASAPAARSSGPGRGATGPQSLDGVSAFMGLRWDNPETVRLTIRPELINRGGLLSGVATYALVDYCMGSTLWAQTSEQERIATINIAINYVQTATEGEIVCSTTLDRRNRRSAVMRSEVRHEDGRLLVSAIGSYSIFPPRERPPTPPVR